ncbi:MAG: flagellar hook-associated protein FlgK [Gammaproteobacteria bacterium]
MAGGDILGVGVSGALAAQRALSTTGHNIANATTEGFSRQRVDMAARKPQMAGNGAIGTGVNVNNVSRVYDGFVVGELRDTTASSSALDIYHHYTSQVDNMLADPEAGLAPSLQNFFGAVNGVADEPSSTSARQVMISEANSLSDRFSYINRRFENLRNNVTNDMRQIATEVNDMAKAIADINHTIIQAREIGGAAPNDLLDQRDRLVQQLAAKTTVRVSEQDDGRLNVFIGNGQTLVVGDEHSTIEVRSGGFDPSQVDVVIKGTGGDSIITRFLEGGALGGLLEFRNGVLDTAQNELGLIAIGISKSFNEQHRLGMDLQSEMGGNFFAEADKSAPIVLPNTKNHGDMEFATRIIDSDKLTTSDYHLIYRQGTYTLLRLQDDTVIGQYTSIPQDIESEGFSIDNLRGSTIKDGDIFEIRPTRDGAKGFDVEINNVIKIAAASPLRTEASVNNLGSAEILPADSLDKSMPAFALATDSALKPPFVIRFVDENNFEVLDNTGKAIPASQVTRAPNDEQLEVAQSALQRRGATPAIPATETEDGRAIPAVPPGKGLGKPDERPEDGVPVLKTAIAYDREKGVDLFPGLADTDSKFRIRIAGDPRKGDMFRVEFNSNGVGDNQNVLRLASLQDKPTLANGTSNYSQVYAQLVSRVGSKTHELEVNSKAQKLLLDQATERRESISGVNLDEEAANMIRFQNLYQANAQVLATANKMFDVLIGAFR